MRLFLYATLLIIKINFYAQTLTSSAPTTYLAKNNVVIENKIFSSGLNGVTLSISNCSGFIIRNCVFKNTPTSISIQLSNCSDIQIQGCSFDSIKSGVYAINCSGKIVIQCNSFKDIIGPKPRGQMVQFNNCIGSGNRVINNILEQTSGIGNPEDLINMYASSGTSSDPIQISGNKTRGGGPSTSGGGIMLGDNGSHDIVADNNVLVNPGQYGIAAPSGQNITISNNTLYAISQPFTNVGLYVGLQAEIDAGFSCAGSSIKVSGNKVNWKNKNNVQNDIYLCSCCAGVISTGNITKAPISASVLPTILNLDNTCASLNLNCSVLGNACPTITEVESVKEEGILDIHVQNKKVIAYSALKSNWQVINLNGILFKQIENSENIEVDMSSWQEGLYILIYTSTKGRKTHKFYYSNN